MNITIGPHKKIIAKHCEKIICFYKWFIVRGTPLEDIGQFMQF